MTETSSAKAANPLSLFEFWPGWLFYTPVVLYWFVLGFRYRSLTVPTAANPRIVTGGLCGESKSSILDMAGTYAAGWIAPYTTLTTGKNDMARALAAIKAKGLALPVVVKPDIGCNGTGVRLVRTLADLDKTLAAFPRGIDLVIQRLILWPHEAGLFYIRHPDDPQGHISSLTYKDIPSITGNGRDTVLDLLRQDNRAARLPDLYEKRLAERLHTVLPEGERLELLFTGNHCKGAIFHNGGQDITPELTARIDAIMQDIPDFHFGRIDVKYRSREALRAGQDFEIIEINGVGSEATHIWDSRTTLREAYAAQFHHYGESFRIGASKVAQGWRPTGLWRGIRLWRKQKRLLASYPPND
ncbi:D-alanine--D-alanine ligase [Acetobacter suratthaniensis]|uniref:D-alanine--D-alanine ligase n=1 Tax=Acetobacter suratthaniensis TaxID=1502841 RepID=A0ABS3LII0_9PROT|nr:D-alanine--D-alanine ligase [Acetobacter suratthaniensis]MBO1327413.1 D-alanine--D-alanine ligase [Acetobacter suratthaniensis]MCX2564974.1 D-alanine--D-alanine ligase [Acetobacter suratthaniensis]